MNSFEQVAEDVQEGATTTVWTAETPFIEPAPPAREDAGPRASETFGPRDQYLESPFLSSWGTGPQAVLGPKAEAFAHFMAEVHDSELEDAYEAVVNEVSALVAERFSYEAEDPAQLEAEAAEAVRDYLQPLQREAEAMLDRMIEASGERDAAALTEAEVEALVDGSVGELGTESPVFEDFLKKLAQKVKKVAQAAKKVAKKIGKVLPLKVVLDKVKRVVRPLLAKVVAKALNRLPPAVRPIATQLAKKMLGRKGSGAPARKRATRPSAKSAPPPAPEPVSEPEPVEADDAGDGGAEDDGADAADADDAPAASDSPADAVEDADAQLAGSTIEGEAFEQELELEEFAARQTPNVVAPMLRLDRARADFARRIVSLQPGEPAEPVFESFLPAVMTAVKLGVKLIGRPKVVKFLANQMARLMKPFIGQQNAAALAPSLASAGLKLIGLEAAEPAEAADAAEADPRQVGYALASTVEGTVARLATAPESVFEDEAMLEVYAGEALEQAAAAALPDELMKEDARETAKQPGVWAPMPRAVSAKRYLKYSRVIDVTLTPQAAKAVKTFGGITLATMLRDRAGVKVGKPVRAKLHLYQAMPGTTLSLIASLEKNVRGLGSANQQSWGLLFPLTRHAASALTGESGLGADPPARFLQNPNLISVGQRFGYLEVQGAGRFIDPPNPGRAPEASHTGLLLDLVNGVIVLRFYYSEADASELVRLLRAKAPVAALIKALTSGRDVQIRALFSGTPTPHLRLVHEAMPVQGEIPSWTWNVLKLFGEKAAKRLVAWGLDALKGALEKSLQPFTDQLTRAVEAPQDGVTLMIKARVPVLVAALKKMIAHKSARASGAGSSGQADLNVEIRPGNVRW